MRAGAPTIHSALRPPSAAAAESRAVRIGFVPLTDCAPLVIAKERGFFRAEGLDVTLVRESSWASVRDDLGAGVLDAAQMLAPMTLASRLGLGGMSVPFVTSLSLGLHGNAVTISNHVYEEMCRVAPESAADSPLSAAGLLPVLRARREANGAPLVFGVVFPFSSHNYELRYWLAAGGVDPDRDVQLVVAPPGTMVPMLSRGEIDGFCVGEPWNRHAVHLGLGRTVVGKAEIWGSSPEKVLAVRRDWAERYPATHGAMLRALIAAARWIDPPERRTEVAHVISGESHVDAPVEVVLDSLIPPATDEPPSVAATPIFYGNTATFPWRSHALWYLGQMVRWGQVAAPPDPRALVESVYRPDVYRQAALEVGVPFPSEDYKIEGLHTEPWTLEQASEPIAMGADTFLDGEVFDPGSFEFVTAEDAGRQAPAADELPGR